MKTGEKRTPVYVFLFDGVLYAVAAYDATEAMQWFKTRFRLVGGSPRVWRIFDAYSYTSHTPKPLDLSL